MHAFRVICQIDDVEHVYIVMADNKQDAKVRIAELNGWKSWLDGGMTAVGVTHPWHPRRGSWSVRELTEDDGPFFLYEFNRKTGDMQMECKCDC